MSAASKLLRIATHNGKFHADEVFAISLLRHLPQFQTAEVIRTRDPEILKTADVVLDVGGVYDPQNHRYDHHQPEFKDSFSKDFKTLLSSAGLVYKHFGKEIIHSQAPHLANEQVDALFLHIYREFVEAFDAHDNGISAYPEDVKPRYASPFDIFWHVDLLNPAWNAPAVTAEVSNNSFVRAVGLVTEAFDLYLSNCLQAWLPARGLVLSAANDSFKATSSHDAHILKLPMSCPWKDHLFGLPQNDQILYVVYPETANGSWRIQAVPMSPDSFQSRLPLPVEWQGLRDAELDTKIASERSEVPEGAVFVHRSGFIGGHKTEAGVLGMAHLALARRSTKAKNQEI